MEEAVRHALVALKGQLPQLQDVTPEMEQSSVPVYVQIKQLMDKVGLAKETGAVRNGMRKLRDPRLWLQVYYWLQGHCASGQVQELVYTLMHVMQLGAAGR